MRKITYPLAVAAALATAAALLGGTPASAVDETVDVGDIWFCDETFNDGTECVTEIEVGDTVTWDFTPSTVFTHTVTDCGVSCGMPTVSPLFDSGLVDPSDPDRTYEFTFNAPGEYPYYCVVHPFAQLGRIIVTGDAELIGDVNGNGVIDAIDAALVLQFNAGLLGSLPSMTRADTDEDGVVNALDAALILQYNAGFIDTLPP